MSKSKGMNIFNSVALPNVKESTFDLSHDLKLSFRMGQLIPTCCIETMPGDRFVIENQNMLRFAPLVAPVMHDIDVHTHYFFVPNRIIWPEFDRWITGDLDVEAPYVDPTLFGEDGIPVGSLADYLGYPTGGYQNAADTTRVKLSPLPVAAYYKVYDEYFRDQNLINEKFADLVPGNNNTEYVDRFIGDPLRRAWEHDYYTASLPFAQKGDAVQVPLVFSENVPVEAIDLTGSASAGVGQFMKASDGTPAPIDQVEQAAGPAPLSRAIWIAGEPVYYNPNGSLVVDIQSDAVDINTLRRALQLQKWLETNARGGTRYTEFVKAHFGVRSSDARLQRPEYIGGQKQKMVISEVLATAQDTTENQPIGEMAGHGISVGGSRRMSYYCEEHGWIIGIISVRPRTAYQQGVHRKFTRFDRLDYPYPLFANIGEQEVLGLEVQKNTNQWNVPFGYVPRYAEMKYENSRVAGAFRDTLAYWHLGRIFEDNFIPLNGEFVECNPRTDIFSVTDENEDHIWSHVFHNVYVRRKLPKFGIPTI